MKNQLSSLIFKMPSSLLFVLFLLFILSNCKKDGLSLEIFENPNVYSSFIDTIDAQEQYYHDLIKTAAVGLFELAKDPTFRDRINSMVLSNFDNDDNTLLKNVNIKMQTFEIDLLTEFQNSISIWQDSVYRQDIECNSKYKFANILNTDSEILDAINGFVYDFDNTFYIQIYIPFADSIDLNDCPVIALGMNDECETDGYFICSAGNLSCFEVTEEFAKTNLVWVISVNEVVDNDGNVPENIIETSVDGIRVNKRAAQDNTVRISKLKITYKKECWLCGKADIGIIMPSVEYNSCNEKMIAYSNCFQKIANKDVGKILNLTQVMFPGSELGTNYRPLRFIEDVGWILYEKDIAIRKNRRENAIPACTKKYNYYSNQSPYGISGFFILGPRNDWNWHEEGMYVYYGDANTTPGSGISFEMRRVD